MKRIEAEQNALRNTKLTFEYHMKLRENDDIFKSDNKNEYKLRRSIKSKNFEIKCNQIILPLRKIKTLSRNLRLRNNLKTNLLKKKKN